MPREWTDEEIRAMVDDSVRIVNEDREKATYARLHEKHGAKPVTDPKDPKSPPPAKDTPPDPDSPPDKPKRKPLWGAYAEDDAT